MTDSLSVPLFLTLASQKATNAINGTGPAIRPTGGEMQKRLSAVWKEGAVEYDLGIPVAFAAGTSFAGTHGTLTLAWPDLKNPRTTGDWWRLLVPDDTARIDIALVIATHDGDVRVPLLRGVPSPDGVGERYEAGREVIEIKMEDVTGVAARMKNYLIPQLACQTVTPLFLANAYFAALPFVCLYPVKPVSTCIERFPNALMAADDVLIARQNALDPLEGKKRIRYGDRDGRIVYRIVEDPPPGEGFIDPFPPLEPAFTYGPERLERNVRVEPQWMRFALPRINPYLDLAARVGLAFPRAGLDETVAIRELGWRVMPRAEQMTVKARRQLTL